MNLKKIPTNYKIIALTIIGAALLLFYKSRAVDPCQVSIAWTKVHDPYMRALVAQDSYVKVLEGYYACHEPLAGDLVWYRYTHDKPAVIRRIVAAAGDYFELKPEKTFGGWNLYVNKEPVMDLEKKRPYFFGAKTPPPLSQNAVSFKSVLPAGNLIVLSSFSPGFIDSGVFGAVAQHDILGKIELR